MHSEQRVKVLELLNFCVSSLILFYFIIIIYSGTEIGTQLQLFLHGINQLLVSRFESQDRGPMSVVYRIRKS